MYIERYIKFNGEKYYCDIKLSNMRLKKVCSTKKELKEYIRSKFIQNDLEKKKTTNELWNFSALYEDYKHTKSMNWTKGTIRNYDMYFKIYFQDIVFLNLKEFNLKKLAEWCDDVKKEHNGRSKKQCLEECSPYLKSIYGLMYNLLEYAFEKGLMPRINLQILKYPITYKDTSLQNDFITEEEMLVICDSIKNNVVSCGRVPRELFITLIKFLFYTGCRINEARAIQLKDIQRVIDCHGKKVTEKYQIHFMKQFQDGSNDIVQTKNKSVRYVFLEKKFYTELLQYCNVNGFEKNDFIFQTEEHEYPLSRSCFSKIMKKIILKLQEKSILSDRINFSFHPHCFRYSNTLYWKQKGVPYTLAAYMHGHTPDVMLRIYDRIDNTAIIQAFSKKI